MESETLCQTVHSQVEIYSHWESALISRRLPRSAYFTVNVSEVHPFLAVLRNFECETRITVRGSCSLRFQVVAIELEMFDSSTVVFTFDIRAPHTDFSEKFNCPSYVEKLITGLIKVVFSSIASQAVHCCSAL